MLAGVPQAPSRNNPLSNPKRSEIRRNWILGRMLSLDMIDRATHDEAVASTDIASFNGLKVEVDADYVAEMARQFAVERLGSNAYTDGYGLYNRRWDLQQAARDAVIEGLITYDNRHGWRGPEQQHSPLEEETSEELGKRWRAALRAMPVIADLRPAIVTELLEDGARVLLRDGSYGFLSWREDLRRIRRYLDEDRRTGSAQTLSDLLSVGDLIRVSEKGDSLRLAQVPRSRGTRIARSKRRLSQGTRGRYGLCTVQIQSGDTGEGASPAPISRRFSMPLLSRTVSTQRH